MLTEFCQEKALVIALSPNNTRDDSTHVYHHQYWNQIDYILCPKDGEALYSQQKTRLGADCGSDHELLIAKFRLKLKKVGKSTRSFRYDLNQIPYDYTVEVTNRFKGLDLIDRVLKNYRWKFVTLYRRQWSRPSPRKRNAKRQNGCLRRPYCQAGRTAQWDA